MTLEEMKKVKRERGYSLAQLSEYTGVPLGTLQKIFSGETAAPRFKTMQALERVLAPNYSADSMVREALAYRVDSKEEWKGEKRQGEYTLEEYYTMPDDRRAELIDGVIYDMNSPTFVHQRIAGIVYYQIFHYIEEKKGRCIPMMAPVDVCLDCDNRTMVQPDILIICDHSKIMKWGILGAPEFVLEVLSPATKWMDCMKKLGKYQNAGVKEYWIIDPYQKKMTVYDYRQEGWPQVFELAGEVGMALFGGDLKINLDRVAEVIQEWPAGGEPEDE